MKHTPLWLALLSASLVAGGDIVPVEPSVEVQPAAMPAKSMAEEEPMMAASKFYIGGALGAASLKTDRFGSDTVADIMALAGYDIASNLAIEGRILTGLSSGDRLSHDYTAAIYLKPHYTLAELPLDVYALLGYGTSKITYDNEPAEQGIANNTTTQGGFSYGIGAAYMLDTRWSLFGEAVRYIDEDTLKPEGRYAIRVDGFSLGVLYRF